MEPPLSAFQLSLLAWNQDSPGKFGARLRGFKPTEFVWEAVCRRRSVTSHGSSHKLRR